MLEDKTISHRADGLQIAPNLAIAPAPWSLTGDGWVIFYRFDRSILNQNGIERPELKGRWRGGLGAVAWMNYHTSPVGPYGEVMFIPGRFEIGDQRYFSISRIYVSSWESVVSGRANWGIPKDRAAFRFDRREMGEEHLSAALEGEEMPFAELLCRPSSASIPVNTRVLPVQMAQVWEGRVLVTALTLKARAHWLDVLSVRAKREYFPDTRGFTPLGGVKLADFDIVFPPAKVVPYET